MADRKISDLTALTAPASGDYLPIVDISEAAAASKNKRITIEELFRGIPLGTAAAPSIAIEGDEDTGIYSPGANQLAVTTNGTQRLTVDTAATTSTLPVVHPLGTAGAPTITFTGDPNTGIYSPGADQVAVATNGTGRLVVDDNGRVLVGTTTATNNIRLNQKLAIVHAGDGTYTGAQFTGYSGTNVNACPLLEFNRTRGITDGSLTKIESGDRIGLIQFRGSDGAAFGDMAAIECYADAATSAGDVPGRLVFRTTADGANAPTERLRITSDGKVGIGTASPSSPLHVLAPSAAGGVSALIAMENNHILRLARVAPAAGPGNLDFTVSTFGAGTIAADNQLTLQAGASAPLVFNTNGASERLRIDSSGRVGIGTSSPGVPLEVNGETRLARSGVSTQYISFVCDSGANSISSVSVGKPFHIVNTDTTANTVLYTGGAPRLLLDSSGRVGIGTTSPGYALDVSGAVRATGDGSSVAFAHSGDRAIRDVGSGTSTYLDLAFGSASHGQLIIRSSNAGTERARIDSSGRLLVGTSTSIGGSTLQVAGTGGNPLEVSRFAASNAGPFLALLKSRGATVGTNTVVAQDDLLGAVQFSGADGSAYQPAANIRAFVDGATVSSTSMPGRLVFSTTADGANSPTERMRISNDGAVKVAGDNFQIATSKTPASATAAGTVGQIAWDANYIYVCTATNTWKRSALATW